MCEKMKRVEREWNVTLFRLEPAETNFLQFSFLAQVRSSITRSTARRNEPAPVRRVDLVSIAENNLSRGRALPDGVSQIVEF